jgi:hypothetical protein
MSNRKKLPASVGEQLAAKDGARIAGGCNTCNAVQVVTAHEWGRNVQRVTIAHDSWCPGYRRMRREGRAR